MQKYRDREMEVLHWRKISEVESSVRDGHSSALL